MELHNSESGGNGSVHSQRGGIGIAYSGSSNSQNYAQWKWQQQNCPQWSCNGIVHVEAAAIELCMWTWHNEIAHNESIDNETVHFGSSCNGTANRVALVATELYTVQVVAMELCTVEAWQQNCKSRSIDKQYSDCNSKK